MSPYQLLARAGLCGRHYKCSRVLGRVTRTVISMCYTAPVSILLTTTYHVGGSSVIILITTHRSGAASSQHGNRLCGHSVAGASQAGHLVIWLQPTVGVKSPDWFNCSHAVLGWAGLGWAGIKLINPLAPGKYFICLHGPAPPRAAAPALHGHLSGRKNYKNCGDERWK